MKLLSLMLALLMPTSKSFKVFNAIFEMMLRLKVASLSKVWLAFSFSKMLIKYLVFVVIIIKLANSHNPCYNNLMAYDIKFRKTVLNYIDKGHTIREAARIFEVDAKTITAWRKLHRETGQLQDRPRETWHKKIDPVKLEVYFEENPDSYLSEAAEVFNCSVNAIFKARKRLGITRKKN